MYELFSLFNIPDSRFHCVGWNGFWVYYTPCSWPVWNEVKRGYRSTNKHSRNSIWKCIVNKQLWKKVVFTIWHKWFSKSNQWDFFIRYVTLNEVDQTCKRLCQSPMHQSHNVVWCGAVCFFPYGPAANILSVGGWNTCCTLHKSEGEVTRSAAYLTV